MRLPWHAQLQFDGASPPTPPAGLSRSKARRRITAIGVVVLMLALPVAVSANHIFSDVPTSNTFHAAISTLYGSRITGGCGSGKYCPNAAVTRGSMAAFLVRGLGRMASTTDGSPNDWEEITQEPAVPGDPHPYGTVAPLSFRHGGGVGGTGLVFATGTVQIFTNEPGVCPCEVQAVLFNNDTGETSQFYFGMLGTEFAPPDPDLAIGQDPGFVVPAYNETTLTMSYAFSVNSGVVNDYAIALRVIATTPQTISDQDDLLSGWDATLQTVYVPFNENGENPLGPPATQGKPNLQNPRAKLH